MERELDTNFMIDQYIGGLKTVLDELPHHRIEQLIAMLHQARICGNQVFIMGNGGSASTATHFVCDLAKNTQREDLPGFRAIGLTDNMALFSSLANDEGYENVFTQQLRNLVQANDIVIAISGSGNSRNVIKAVELANAYGARTVGLTGMGGGQLAKIVSLEIRVPSDLIQQVEDVHLMIEHLVCSVLKTIQPEPPQELALPELEYGLFSAPVEVTYPVPVAKKPVSRQPVANPSVATRSAEELHRIMEEALSLSGARSITLILMDNKGDLSHALMMRNDGQVEGVQSDQLSDVVQKGLAGWVMRNRKAALVNNTQHDPRWLTRVWEEQSRPARSAMSIPLTVSNHVVGTMTLVGQQSHQFSMQDLTRLSELAASLAPDTGTAPL